MLTKIGLRNFQKHGKFDLELDAVTTIVGESDSGKSATIRALRWLCFNDSAGNAFFKSGESECIVRLRVDDAVISRVKNKENKYVLKKNDESEEFKAVNKNVPLDVQRLLQVSDLNFQSQHDAPFWLAITAGQLSKQLNEIADLELMDSVQAESKSRLSECEREIVRQKEDIQKHEEYIAKMNYVDDALKDLEEVETLESQYLTMNASADRLLDAMQSQEAYQETLNVALIKKEKYVSAINDAQCILSLQEDLDNIIADGKKLVAFMQEVKAAEMPLPPLALLEDCYNVEKEIQRLEGLVDSQKDAQKLYNINKKIVVETKEQIEKVEVCPTCNRPL